MIAETLNTPYYAVIFTSERTFVNENYGITAERMEELAKQQEGYLGIESAREEVGITVSYWESIDAIVKWKNNLDHTEAREKGRSTWYKRYKVRICLVERDYYFEK